MGLKMRSKFDSYWKESNLLKKNEVVLDPMYKAKWIEFIYKKSYDPNYFENSVSGISSDGIENTKTTRSDYEYDEFMMENSEIEVQKTELEKYLEEPLLMTTVASESMFNVDGRVLTSLALLCSSNWLPVLNDNASTEQRHSNVSTTISSTTDVSASLLVTSQKSTSVCYPPFPPKLPVIGNLHQIGPLLHRSFHDLSRNYGPIMLLHLGHSPTLAVSSAEMAIEVLKNQDLLFANRPFTVAGNVLLYGCTDIAFSPNNEYLRKIRRMCSFELLSVKRTQTFKFAREEETHIMIRKIQLSSEERNKINLSEMLLALANDIICRCTLGKKYEKGDNKRYRELPDEVTKLLGVVCSGDVFPSLKFLDVLTGFICKLKALSKEVDVFLDEVIDEHLTKQEGVNVQEECKEYFVDILLASQTEHLNLTRNNMKAILLDMFIGGTGTTSTTLTWAMSELIKKPTLMKKAQDEVRGVIGKKLEVEEDDISQMKYLRCIVKETLRLHPPVPLLVPRENLTSTKIKGYDIPPNTTVFVNAWTIQRDSKIWKEPEEFLPERFADSQTEYMGSKDYEFMPFGSGRRGCPGIPFGVAIVELVLANLLFWFDWELPDGADYERLDMTRGFSIPVVAQAMGFKLVVDLSTRLGYHYQHIINEI
ncbi:cytochrome P450 71A1-like [Papaver somniferum]|uniref:cytochrome P450 71A1-like n=1 Tax=Papaver somniferum TaxID=3469 RepID=UPI000E6FA255|nr:cytochrome P450 71A1-like [Papaver somniferum]